MNPKPHSQPPITKLPTAFERVVARLIDKLTKDATPEHPGVIMPASDVRIDDLGGYSDPHIDQRPSFVVEDEIGWTRLK